MNKIQLMALGALIAAPLIRSQNPVTLPKFTPKPTPKDAATPYKDAADRALWYTGRGGVMSREVFNALHAAKADHYVLIASVTKVSFLGSPENLEVWQADDRVNPQGSVCPVGGKMNFYEKDANGKYSVLYTVEGLGDPSKKTSEGLSVTATHPGAEVSIASKLTSPKGGGPCAYPTVIEKHALAISNPIKLGNGLKGLKDAISSMAQFAAQQAGAQPKTANDLRSTPGIGGIIFYDAQGTALMSFYTNGWENKKEGWTAGGLDLK